jgi:hypothetical protein
MIPSEMDDSPVRKKNTCAMPIADEPGEEKLSVLQGATVLSISPFTLRGAPILLTQITYVA